MDIAELLIMAKDSNGSGGGQYKKGDIVTVMPEGNVWGKKEVLPMFVVVKFPGDHLALRATYCNPDVDKDGKMLRRRDRNMQSAEIDAIVSGGGEKVYASQESFSSKMTVKAPIGVSP